LAGCQKEINYETAEEKLADKTWYLEKKSVGQQAFTYAAVSTFSFRLSKNLKKYSDSDGIEGTYTLTEQAPITILTISSPTRQIEAYQLTLLEKEYAILEYTKNNVLHTFYFATR